MEWMRMQIALHIFSNIELKPDKAIIIFFFALMFTQYFITVYISLNSKNLKNKLLTNSRKCENYVDEKQITVTKVAMLTVILIHMLQYML